MSKNLTRKGLAFGALVALASSVIAGAPANAAGVDNTASLLPSEGYESGYAVAATSSATFGLTSVTTHNSGGTIKFKVTDAAGKIEPISASGFVGRTAYTVLNADTVGSVAATGIVTVTSAATTFTASDLAVGDSVVFAAPLTTAGGAFTAANTAYAITDVTASTFSFKSATTWVTGGNRAAVASTAGGAVKAIREARAADNSYVIDTGILTNSARTATVKFKSLDGADYTRSAKVQEWVDDSALLNDVIDTIESTSVEREITFVKLSDITATTSLTAPKIGDASLTAKVSTTPVLNGAQSQADLADLIKVQFTRQDSAVKGVSAAITQSTVDGTWTGSITLDTDSNISTYVSTTAALGSATTDVWGFTRPTTRAAGAIAAVSVTAAKVATINTDLAHNLRTGDKVTVVSTDTGLSVIDETAVKVTVTGEKSFTYSVSETTAVTAASVADASATAYSVATYTASDVGSDVSLVDRVFAGDYSAQALVRNSTANAYYTANGSDSSFGTAAALATDVKFVSTGSATVQGASVAKATSATGSVVTDSVVKTGALTATVVATIVDVDGAAVSAGRPVAWTMTRSNGTLKVNDRTTGTTTLTDANGQVTFTVTDTLGLAGTKLTIDATAEGVSTAATAFTFEWADQAFGLYDLNTTASTLKNNSGGTAGERTIAKGSSYDLALLVADQWGTAVASDTYRLRVAGSGVTEGLVTLTAGKATVKVSDNGVSTSIVSTIALQKKSTAGVWADVDATAYTMTTTTTDKGGLTLAADAASLYASTTADLSDLVAAKALVARDIRTSFTAQPAYTNDVVVTGKAASSSTGVSLARSLVTISGPNDILFSNGSVDKLGSITVVADGNGEFAVSLYSVTAQKDTVITVKANGVEKTVKVTFTGVSTSIKKLAVTANAATYIPGQTVLFTIKLTDDLGNPVNTTAPATVLDAAYITVSYAGPGIISQTLPVETDASGEAQVRIVTGVVDTQEAVLTVKYDQNYDGDFVDTYDLTATSTVYAAGKAPNSAVAAASGSTGKFYVSATNAANRTVVVKVAGKFVKSFVPGSASKKVVAIAATKGSKAVTVFVGGKLALTKTVTVK